MHPLNPILQRLPDRLIQLGTPDPLPEVVLGRPEADEGRVPGHGSAVVEEGEGDGGVGDGVGEGV